jgi:hypothetical protein
MVRPEREVQQMHFAAAQPARRQACNAQRRQEVAVRQFVSAGVAVTLIDDRADDDGFGHPDADPVLLREAVRWLEDHPTMELTSIHAGLDSLGRRQLTVTAFGDLDEDPASGAGPARLVVLPETG